MRPKIGDAIPAGHTENDERDDEIGNRTGERIDEVANSEVLPIHRKRKRVTAVRNRAELDEHPEDAALKQLFADPDHNLKDVQVQGTRGQRMTEFVRDRSENSKNVEQKECQ